MKQELTVENICQYFLNIFFKILRKVYKKEFRRFPESLPCTNPTVVTSKPIYDE